MSVGLRLPTLALAAGLCLISVRGGAQHPEFDLSYPEARRGNDVDAYHSVEVPDPYRWLEEMESPATRAWVKAQDDLFRSFVGALSHRDALEKRIEEISRIGSYSAPTHVGDRTFYTRTEPGRSRGVLYVQTTAGSPPRVLIDLETFPYLSQGEQVAGWRPSPDGKLLAFGVSPGQSAWRRVKILEVDTGILRADELVGLGDFSSVQWTGDGRGLIYRRYDRPKDETSATFDLENPRVCHHRLGTDQFQDRVMASFPDRPDWFIGSLTLTPDDRFLVIGVREKRTRTRHVFYRDLHAPDDAVIKLVEGEDRFTFITNQGTKLIFQTDQGAPLGRIVAIDVRSPVRKQWVELVPEKKEQRLNNVVAVADRMIARYLVDARPVLEVFHLSGQHDRTVTLPGIGGVGIMGRPGDPNVYYSFGNLFTPGLIYRLDLESGSSILFRKPELEFDPDRYLMKQVFYSSFDGTRVPMFIAHRKDLKLTGDTPLWMYGYGHGGWSAFPWFQAHLVAWLDIGGVYALPGIRGGGEYGSEWTKAGMGRNKPNTIADYIAATEWLIENGYTSSARMVANGGSASGMIPAAVIVKRPELFGAAVIDVPYLDLIRYPLFAHGFTSGIGSPDDPDDFRVLLSYSPYHNLEEGSCYPATLVSVAEKDQSTAPLHCYKFTAAMQRAQKCSRPVLMQVIWDSGHYTYGTTPEQRHESLANQIAFLVRALDLDVGSSLTNGRGQ